MPVVRRRFLGARSIGPDLGEHRPAQGRRMQAGGMIVQEPGDPLPGVVQFWTTDGPSWRRDIRSAGAAWSRLRRQAVLRQPHFAVRADPAGDGQPKVEHVTDTDTRRPIADLEYVGEALMTDQRPLRIVPATLMPGVVRGPDPRRRDLRDGIDRFGA